MVRAPCCEKMGLKKGPWTKEEDQTLIDYINQLGHGNWRALPKQAGLLRCGKSCRLRWTNYLRPDIKRGNFSREEEDSIIELHELLGNRWSAIAAKLPGRTDNEIKNVWHTHLKKRLRPNQSSLETKPHSTKTSKSDDHSTEKLEPKKPIHNLIQQSLKSPNYQPIDSPQLSSSEVSSITNTTITDSNIFNMEADALDNFPELDENFWSDVWSDENSRDVSSYDHQLQSPVSPLFVKEHVYGYDSSMHDDMGFWYNVFTGAGDLQQLPDF